MGWWKRLFGQIEPKKKPEFSSGPSAGWISVWVGDLTDELDLDGYLYDFDRDHRLYERSDDGGYTVEPSPAPLEPLLQGFHLSERWLPAVIEAGRGKAIERACCAVVQFHYRHQPVEEAPGPLRFVASVKLEP